MFCLQFKYQTIFNAISVALTNPFQVLDALELHSAKTGTNQKLTLGVNSSY